MLIWLLFWTLGGIAASRELLRLLFGRDRFVVRNDGLEIEHSFGLFRSIERLSHQDIRRFYQAPAGAALSAAVPGKGPQRRTIYHQSHDPTEPRNLGLWLSQRCQIPFADLTTAESKAKELQALKEKLAGSGRVGRAVVGVIDRLESSSENT